jgi:hypothetical protein
MQDHENEVAVRDRLEEWRLENERMRDRFLTSRTLAREWKDKLADEFDGGDLQRLCADILWRVWQMERQWPAPWRSEEETLRLDSNVQVGIGRAWDPMRAWETGEDEENTYPPRDDIREAIAQTLHDLEELELRFFHDIARSRNQ